MRSSPRLSSYNDAWLRPAASWFGPQTTMRLAAGIRNLFDLLFRSLLCVFLLPNPSITIWHGKASQTYAIGGGMRSPFRDRERARSVSDFLGLR